MNQLRTHGFLAGIALLIYIGRSSMAAELAPSPAHPFPQHINYIATSIRPNHRTQKQLDDDVRAFYTQWKQEFIKPAGMNSAGLMRYRVAFGKDAKKSARTVSEGQGYGMVIVALMAGYDPDAQAIFNGLYDFALAHPSAIEGRLMAWEVPSKQGVDSAFDGDADIAYALLLAYAQWGGAGRVDYAAAARTRLAGILVATIGPQSRLPTLGDWVVPDGSKANQYTPRSSDFMLGHFRAWARFTGDSVWNTVAGNCATVISAIQTHYSSHTGLLPDFIISAKTAPRPAQPQFLEAVQDGDYYYNAGRTPWRVGGDGLINGNATSCDQARKMSAWAMKATHGDPQKLRSGYQLDGTPLKGSDYFSSFFAAPLGVAAMLDTENQAWLNSLYDGVRTTHEDYYEDSVTLQCLLVMSGNFWDPTTSGNIKTRH